MDQDARQHPRTSIELRAEVRTMAGKILEATCTDISFGGARLQVAEMVDYGTKVELSLFLPREKRLELKATARWSSPDVLGVQFDMVRAKQAYTLSELLSSLKL